MIKLFLLAIVLAIGTTVYSKLTFVFFLSEFFAIFEKFIKVVQNVKLYHERSLLRNLVFNLSRCMFPEFFYMVLLGRQNENTLSIYAIRTFAVVFFTVLVQFLLPKKSINNNSGFWSMFYVTYAGIFGAWWVFELGQAEFWSEGHIDAFLFYTVCAACSYMQGDLMEDLLFRDMNVLGFSQNFPWLFLTSFIAL